MRLSRGKKKTVKPGKDGELERSRAIAPTLEAFHPDARLVWPFSYNFHQISASLTHQLKADVVKEERDNCSENQSCSIKKGIGNIYDIKKLK